MNVVLICLFILIFSGCANLKEVGKGILGTSTKQLEEARPQAIKKVFNYEYKVCYNKVSKALTNIQSYVYAKNEAKKMLAIYVSSSDTTVVGVFFKEINSNSTQIEIASPSTYAKELIANKLFLELENLDKIEKEKQTTGGIDAVRQQP